MTKLIRIALVAHDAKKDEITRWALEHRALLSNFTIWATGNTGSRVVEATDLMLTPLLSGPEGGDQQIGALIAKGNIDVLIFFIDPLSSLPHDVDVKALLRIGALYQIAMACNEQTASHIMRSMAMDMPASANDTRKEQRI